ncbi:MAG: 2OG-Fe(II) oxygenase [Hyphomicrobiaceae bacterium]
MQNVAFSNPTAIPHKRSVAEAVVSSLDAAQQERWPFDYWLLQDALPMHDFDAIVDLPFAAPTQVDFNGRRDTNNSTRVFFNLANQQCFCVCHRVASAFKEPNVIAAIEQRTGADLSDTYLRIEYCQDTEGFWLEPRTDISAKKFTMLVYLSDEPALAGAGTDIHEGPPRFNYVTSAPYGKGRGVFFIPGENSWHGVGKRPFTGVRRSIIINYVSPDWRAFWELA